jgi:zinc transport system substrate-binding protein
VVTTVRPGDSAELYQPTDAQISRLADARVYFRTGMPLESGRGFRSGLSRDTLRVVDLREGVRLHDMAQHAAHSHEGAAPGDGHEAPSPTNTSDADGGKDPHIWLSPRLLKVQAQTVANTLAELDPSSKPYYLRNLAAVHDRLDALDQSLRTTLAPLRGRAFLVFHPAWAYFAEEYGLREIAIESEGKEPSDRELTELQRLARDEKIRVIFVQQTATRAARAMAEAIGARTEILDDLAEDVPASLERTARLLVESCGEESGEEKGGEKGP